VIPDDARQRLQGPVNAFARRNQAGRQQNGPPFNPELVFVETRIYEGRVMNPVRNERDFVLRNVIHVAQDLFRNVAHDNQAVAPLPQLTDHAHLVGGRLLQDRMQGADDRHPQPPDHIEDIGPVLAAEDPKFMLDNGHIDLVDVQQLRRNRIVLLMGRTELEIHLGRIGVSVRDVVHGQYAHRAVAHFR
jgi:hypothetical protein